MFIFLQKLLPQHLLSRLLGCFAHARCSVFKNWAIKRFIRYFNVDLSESLITDIREFPTFNDFFIRHLKPGVRPLPDDSTAIVCPADGIISEMGHIHASRLLQAKGRHYELGELCGDPELAKYFADGEFLTVYLAPKDYHRVHIPVDGILEKMIHIPGQLFSVNAISVKSIPNLFARNERVVCLFQTPAGKMAVIFVGALLIGSVVTTWHGKVMPAHNDPLVKSYTDSAITFKSGEEIGYFQWGSTVIVLFERNRAHWQSNLNSGTSVKMGQAVGSILGSADSPGKSDNFIDMVGASG